MNLFDDMDLFAGGREKKQFFDLPDADLMLYEGFFSKEESDFYYNKLLAATPWEEADLTIYDKTHKVPRMIAWYEDGSAPGGNASRNGWTPELLAIKEKVEKETGTRFNSVLLNLYRNGKDGVGWHSDRENYGKNAPIASVTFGETRPFRLRHKTRKDIPQVTIPLRHGSLLLMAGMTQGFWEHHIPKTAKDILPRINLTFRITGRDIK